MCNVFIYIMLIWWYFSQFNQPPMVVFTKVRINKKVCCDQRVGSPTKWVHQRPLMQRSSKLQLQLPWSSGNLVGSSVLLLPHQQPHPPSFQRENSRPSPMKELDSWSSTNPSLGRLRGCNAGGRLSKKTAVKEKGIKYWSSWRGAYFENLGYVFFLEGQACNCCSNIIDLLRTMWLGL